MGVRGLRALSRAPCPAPLSAYKTTAAQRWSPRRTGAFWEGHSNSGTDLPLKRKGQENKKYPEGSSRSTRPPSSRRDLGTCSQALSLGELVTGVGTAWGGGWLGLEPRGALPWGTPEPLQSAEPRPSCHITAEGPGWRQSPRRVAPLLAQLHPGGAAALPAPSPKPRLLAALPFAPSRLSAGAEHARLPGQARSRGRLAKRLTQPASGKPGASAGARQVGKRTHGRARTHTGSDELKELSASSTFCRILFFFLFLSLSLSLG